MLVKSMLGLSCGPPSHSSLSSLFFFPVICCALLLSVASSFLSISLGQGFFSRLCRIPSRISIHSYQCLVVSNPCITSMHTFLFYLSHFSSFLFFPFLSLSLSSPGIFVASLSFSLARESTYSNLYDTSFRYRATPAVPFTTRLRRDELPIRIFQ